MIKTIVKILVAAIVAMVVMCVLIINDASDELCLLSYMGVAIGVAYLLGAFDGSAKRATRYDSIRHRDGLQNAA
jgi:hypothetical protein